MMIFVLIARALDIDIDPEPNQRMLAIVVHGQVRVHVCMHMRICIDP